MSLQRPEIKAIGQNVPGDGDDDELAFNAIKSLSMQAGGGNNPDENKQENHGQSAGHRYPVQGEDGSLLCYVKQ